MADNAVLPRNTKDAPVCEGLSSQTVAFSHYNHFAPALPIDVATGELVAGGAKEQAAQALKNLQTVIESIGHNLDDVVRLTVFLKNIDDLAAVDEVIAGAYTDYFPTRTNVGVNDLPAGADVMIECVISNGEGTIPNAPQAGDLVKTVGSTDKAPTSATSSQLVAFSHYSNVTAQGPIDPATGTVVDGGVGEQTKQALANVKAILAGIDVPVDDIVKINLFLTDLADLDEVNAAYTTFFPDSAIARTAGYTPARTVIQAAGLPDGAKVQVEAVVSHGDGTPPQEVEDRHGLVIWADNTDAAKVCKLATQTVRFSHYNNTTGQLPIDPATGELVAGGVAEQTTRCLDSLKAILESIGHKLADVVRTSIYLTDLADLDQVNEVYREYFPGGAPARRIVGVKELQVPGAKVMIDVVAGNAEGTPPSK